MTSFQPKPDSSPQHFQVNFACCNSRSAPIPHIALATIKISISRSFRVFFTSRNQIGKIINCNVCFRSRISPCQKKIEIFFAFPWEAERKASERSWKEAGTSKKGFLFWCNLWPIFLIVFLFFSRRSLHDMHTHSSGDCFYVQSCGFPGENWKDLRLSEDSASGTICSLEQL